MDQPARETINVSTCAVCGHGTVTVDRDHGVTPFNIRCRNPGCFGEARSGQSLTPAYEWYRPTATQLRGKSKATREHVRKGGLSIRKIGEESYMRNPETPIEELRRLIADNDDECEWLFVYGGTCSERDLLNARNDMHMRAKRLVELIVQLDHIAADAAA